MAAIVGEANVLIVPTDVSKLEQVVSLKNKVYETWDEVRIIAPGCGYTRTLSSFPLPPRYLHFPDPYPPAFMQLLP